MWAASAMPIFANADSSRTNRAYFDRRPAPPRRVFKINDRGQIVGTYRR
jgi:hypothetical protein